MASAWGTSWGGAWGTSWGATVPPPTPPAPAAPDTALAEADGASGGYLVPPPLADWDRSAGGPQAPPLPEEYRPPRRVVVTATARLGWRVAVEARPRRAGATPEELRRARLAREDEEVLLLAAGVLRW